MIAGLAARAQRVGAAARRCALGRLAAQVRRELPDVAVAEQEGEVTITGRRILRDPRLIWIGSLLR